MGAPIPPGPGSVETSDGEQGARTLRTGAKQEARRTGPELDDARTLATFNGNALQGPWKARSELIVHRDGHEPHRPGRLQQARSVAGWRGPGGHKKPGYARPVAQVRARNYRIHYIRPPGGCQLPESTEESRHSPTIRLAGDGGGTARGQPHGPGRLVGDVARMASSDRPGRGGPRGIDPQGKRHEGAGGPKKGLGPVSD
jgi:hypothetical protein